MVSIFRRIGKKDIISILHQKFVAFVKAHTSNLKRNTMSYLEKEQELQSMMGQGQMLEAFEKFYAENVVMHEATGEIFEGKDANRKREEEWMAGMSEIHDGGVKAITSNENEGTTMTESWIDVSFKDGSRMKMEEVSSKKWEGDQIVHERFYYNIPG